MKRLFVTLLLATFIGAVQTASAMSYERAREEAWFLTDKMAYELNLTADQYDYAYKINLDYLLSLRTGADCYGSYWTCRDMDFRAILEDWQYTLYATVDYFFRPVRWLHSAWYFPISDRYRRGSFFFDRPALYLSYRGSAWTHRDYRRPSPYNAYRPQPGRGMRDMYDGGSHSYGNRQAPRPSGGMNHGQNGRPNGNMRDGQPNPSQRSGNTRPPGRDTYINYGNRPSTGYQGGNRNGGNATPPSSNRGGNYNNNNNININNNNINNSNRNGFSGGNRNGGNNNRNGGNATPPSSSRGGGSSSSRPSQGSSSGTNRSSSRPSSGGRGTYSNPGMGSNRSGSTASQSPLSRCLPTASVRRCITVC